MEIVIKSEPLVFVSSIVLLAMTAVLSYVCAWCVKNDLWTKKNTMEMVVSIVSGVWGALLALKLLGFI